MEGLKRRSDRRKDRDGGEEDWMSGMAEDELGREGNGNMKKKRKAKTWTKKRNETKIMAEERDDARLKKN